MCKAQAAGEEHAEGLVSLTGGRLNKVKDEWTRSMKTNRTGPHPTPKLAQ